MKRFALPVVAILLLAGCAGEPPVDDLPPASPPMFAEPGEGESAAIGLVNLWRVADAEGEGAETWLRLDANEFQLWRDCGMIMGAWRATDLLFLASVHGASGECATDSIPEVEWLESATSFAQTADGYELLSGGETVASLTIDGAPEPIDTAAEFYTEPPEITADVRARFTAPAPLPSELEPAAADALEGTWVSPAIASAEPHAAFSADGNWTGSDGCNGGGGRWAVDGAGGFLATSGPSTLIYCEGAAIPSWVAQAASAGFDVDGLLHLFDASGAELGILAR
ncbi:MAG TPA: hypothetical protein VFT01_06305 [Homoserinimonas sp.]|nr:hypothetical protein [Homoserinimonas sp.]